MKNNNEAKMEDIPLIKGKIVEYHALAPKYPFRFQPWGRLYGRRFIPCMIANEKDKERLIETMKLAENWVIIKGKGVKGRNGLYKEIKIFSFRITCQTRLF